MIAGTGPLGGGALTTLWITALIMILGSLYFTFQSFRARPEIKHFYYVTALVPLIAATMYMLMATGYGQISQNGHIVPYARYIDWTFTTPLLLLDLALIALPRNFPARLAVICTIIAADVYMIVTGFIASLIRSNVRWAFFGVSCAGFLAVLFFIVGKLTPEAGMRNLEVKNLYGTLSLTLIVLWLCYPVVWAIGTEGFGVIPFTTEVVLYAILDLLAKVGYGFILLRASRALMDADRMEAPINANAARI